MCSAAIQARRKRRPPGKAKLGFVTLPQARVTAFKCRFEVGDVDDDSGAFDASG
jgi:hypothetical protein